MDNEQSGNTAEESQGILHWIAVGVIGAGLMYVVDWIFGDIVAMLLISAGIIASIVGFGLTATSVYNMVSKLGEKSGTGVMEWWYQNTVPAQSPNKLTNPSREELMEFLAWKMEQEQKAAV